MEVINAGMESTGPGYYLRILEKCGDRIKPDGVVRFFYRK